MAVYDVFVSYSHAKDRPLATALQSVMQRLGKPWYRRRALRVFRDDTSLSATPGLWPSIEEALRRSRHFVLVASPEAARSKWVAREVAFWLEHNGADTLLIGLAEGELSWDETQNDFVAGDPSPLPPPLHKRFAAEPKWVDLRGHRDAPSSRNAGFIELGADFAAFVRGVPKEDLLSEEVRQQRRALRLALSAAFGLLLLAAAALWQWREAALQRHAALAQRDRAERTLAQATEATNQLVHTLADRFRDSGVPAHLIRSVLDTARALQEQLIDGGYATPALRRSQGSALLALVKTLVALGDADGALDAAERARRIYEELATTAPAEKRPLQNNLAVAYGEMADVLYRQGRTGDALARYRTAVSLLEPLVASEPADRTYRKHLAILRGKIAKILGDEGQLDEALALALQSLATRAALARNEADVDARHDLAASHVVVGDVLAQIAVQRRNAGDAPAFAQRLGEATGHFRHAVSMLERLLAAATNTFWSRNLALAYDKLGDALGTQSLYVDGMLAGMVRFQEAEEAYGKAIAILRRLIEADAGNVGWKQDLASVERHLATLLRLAKQRF